MSYTISGREGSEVVLEHPGLGTNVLVSSRSTHSPRARISHRLKPVRVAETQRSRRLRSPLCLAAAFQLRWRKPSHRAGKCEACGRIG